MLDHDPRNTDDKPEPRCNCCGAYLRIESHTADCETQPEPYQTTDEDEDDEYCDGGNRGAYFADDGQP